tara:strand:+ start:716 stop:883 length:168 start_codon:yes stop_codon:yes gene_type:complete
MSRYTIHKSRGFTAGMGSRPLSETVRIRKYGRIRGMEEPGLFGRIRAMLSRELFR